MELFKNLYEAIERFGPRLVEELKKELTMNNHVASGKLVNSLSYVVDYDNRTLELSIEFEDYLKYVCEGTRPHFPPPDKILQWIRVKPVAPRPMRNGKLPTEKQLAYLIGRKISRDGTKGTHDLENVEDRNYDELMRIIDEAVEKDISESLEEILDFLWA